MLRTGNKGFTFVEVMITLVVLSSGIVFIYRTFFLCIDYLSRLSARMHAHELADEKINAVARLLHAQPAAALSQPPTTTTRRIENKAVDFNCTTALEPIAGEEGLYTLQVVVAWADSGRPAHFSRSAVLGL